MDKYILIKKNHYLVSVITVVLNNKDTIAYAMRSVFEQTYKNVEYIIIDGGSTDGTVDVINKYDKYISKMVSEPDNGIYDAMNKGLSLATGNIISFLNADDLYANPIVIETVIKTIKVKNVDCCWGDLVYVDTKNIDKVIRYWKSSEYKPGLYKTGWHPCHPSFFAKREIYEKYGYFDLEFIIAADYELMLRFLKKYKISCYYIPEVLVKMRVGGKSNKNIVNILKANLECYKAWKKNSFQISPFFIIKKPLSKLKQLIK